MPSRPAFITATIRRLTPFLAASLAVAGAAWSQDSTPTLPSPDVPEAILSYLTADRFVEPGVGFREVRIGSSLEQALEAWGAPEQVASRGLLRRSHEWQYRIEDNTRVTLQGRQRIERIRIDGAVGSTIETTRGTRFGMAPYEIAAAYGAAGREAGTSMEYPARGIAFEFVRGQMMRMEVFAPRRER